MVSVAKSSLSFTKDRPEKSAVEGQRALPIADAVTQLTILAEDIGWNYNAVLTGLYFKIAGDIWKATVKCEMASGPKVAYFTGSSLYQLVETVHRYAAKGLFSWNHDKHPVSVRKRRYPDSTHRPR